MRGRARASALVALLLVLALVLGACTGSGEVDTPGRETAAADDGDHSQEADASAPAPGIEGHQRGGRLTVLADKAPVTLDPTRASRPDELSILSLVTRSLTQYRYDPGAGAMVLVPDLATDLGGPNKDFTAWTFTLRPGLTYSDGSAVRAADIAYAVKRAFATGKLPGGPGYNRDYFVDGRRYRGPFRDGTDYAGVKVSGDSITIKMRRPFPDMAHYAALPTFTPIPPAADRRPRRYGMDPLATGPYEFDSYEPGKSLTLRRNRQWDPGTDPARHQYPDTWSFRFGVKANAIDELLIDDEDEAQTTASYTDVQAENYPRTLLDASVKERVVRGSAPCTRLWYLDMRTIESLEVRRAIGLAFPYRQYWRELNEIEGVTRIPATTILPPGTNGRLAYDVLGNAGARTDPAAAAELLAGADEVGFELRFAYDEQDRVAKAARAVFTAAFLKAGFTVTAVPTTGPGAAINMRPGEWCADWPSGAQWFPKILNRPDVDASLDEIAGLPATEAVTAWGELDRDIQQNHYPAVTVGYPGKAFLHGSRVGGMSVNDVRGMPNFTDMFVEQP